MYKQRKLKGDKNKPFTPGDIDWYEGVRPLLREPEYRIHPLMGNQVRSRHKFEPEPLSQADRAAAKVKLTRRQPKVTPYELDPDYRDKKEKVHGTADLKGVKQYPVTLESETAEMQPFNIKSARLKRNVEMLELTLGYDHSTNRRVLYSPLAYNERWDRQSQAVWLRIIGMSPKRISIKLKINYDTVKNWLRALKGQPLVATTQNDWAIRQVEGHPQLATRFSSTEAKPRSMEVI